LGGRNLKGNLAKKKNTRKLRTLPKNTQNLAKEEPSVEKREEREEERGLVRKFPTHLIKLSFPP